MLLYGRRRKHLLAPREPCSSLIRSLQLVLCLVCMDRGDLRSCAGEGCHSSSLGSQKVTCAS